MKPIVIPALFFAAALTACSSMPPPQYKTAADEAAAYNKQELAYISAESCAKVLDSFERRKPYWLCSYGWRPPFEPGGEKAAESYRLYWVRPDQPRLIVRLARYDDGSGVLWVSEDDRSGKPPHMKVNTLKSTEFEPLFAKLTMSPLWASSYATFNGKGEKHASCDKVARWILEGQRSDDHRAVSVQSCGQGAWAVDLGKEMLAFAKTKIPDLSLVSVY